MIQFRFISILLISCATSLGYAKTQAAQESKDTSTSNQVEDAQNPSSADFDLTLISETFGHFVASQLKSMDIDFDKKSLVKGIQQSFDGKTPPMETEKCIQALATIQEEKREQQAQTNLLKANAFMKANRSTEGIIEVEKAQDTGVPLLQYKVVQKGKGATVEEHSSPLIRFKGTLPTEEGKVFAESGEEQLIHLDDMVIGFKKGIVGMQEGEKRTLFIHPTYGFGKSTYLPPNTPLRFEVEVLKANVPAKKAPHVENQLEDNPSTSHVDEIADNEENMVKKGIR